MKESFSAVGKARQFVADSIRQGTWTAGDRLPNLQALASLAKVSRQTMWKAVGQLKNENILQVKERGHITAGSEERGNTFVKPLSGQLWEKKRTIIIQDILNKRFAAKDVLPSLSELQAHYGICYATLRKILNSLVSDKILVPFRKSYRILGLAPSTYRSRIVLLLAGQGVNRAGQQGLRARRLINAAETICAQSKIKLHRIWLDMADPHACARVRAEIINDASASGYVINLWSLPELQQQGTDVIRAMLVHQKPVAVLDESCTFKLQPPFSSDRLVRIFRIGNKAAGQAVARYLLGLGHRKISFFSFQHNSLWSQQRYGGMAAMFTRAGLPAGVCPQILDKVDGACQLVLSLLDVDSATFRNIFRRGLGKTQVEDLLRHYEQIHGKDIFTRSDNISRLRSDVRYLAQLAAADLDTPFYLALHSQAWSFASSAALGAYLEPLFRKALSDPDVTAWVAADDGTAIAALDFLKAMGIPIPGKISVLGFDITAEASAKELTSYDFNMAGFADRMISHILHPDQSHSDFIDVEGMLIERGSSGKIEAQR